MSPGLELLSVAMVAIIIFRGTLSLLPDGLAHDHDRSLTGPGFWIPPLATIALFSIAFRIVAAWGRSDG